MAIRYGLNGATTMPLEQATEIRAAGAAGFDLIEFRAAKLEKFFAEWSFNDLKNLFTGARLRPLSINALEQVNTRPRGAARALEAEARKLVAWAEALACPYVVAVAGFLEKPAPEAEVVAQSADSLALVAEAAAARGVRVGFEFLGFANCSVNSLRLARKILHRLDRPDVGLVLDTFHFFLSGEPLDLLADAPPGEFVVLHVNDAEAAPRAQLADAHRVLPGLGVIPLRQMWAALQRSARPDHASLELFRPDYWARPPAEFLPEALSSLRRIFT